MLKDRLSKTSGWQFHKWLFGPEKLSGPNYVGTFEKRAPGLCSASTLLTVDYALEFSCFHSFGQGTSREHDWCEEEESST